MVEQEGLHQVASVHTDRHLLKKLSNSQVLGFNAFLHQADLVSRLPLNLAASIESINCLLGEAEAVKGVETEVRLAYVVNDEDRVLELFVALVEKCESLNVECESHVHALVEAYFSCVH